MLFFVVMFMMVFAGATLVMMMFMCHIFSFFFVSRCKGMEIILQLGCKPSNWEYFIYKNVRARKNILLNNGHLKNIL